MIWWKVAVVVILVVISDRRFECANDASSFMFQCSGNCKQNPTKLLSQNRKVVLICRDASTLVIGIENELGVKHELDKLDESYVVAVERDDDRYLPSKRVFLTRKSIVKIPNLRPNTAYNISANYLDSQYKYTVSDHQIQFRTLPRKYLPGNVTTIHVEDFKLSADGKGFDVVVIWDPSNDRTCLYNLIIHPESYDYDANTITNKIFNEPEELYHHELKDLVFGMNYTIGIEAVNTKYSTLHSDIWWHVIKTPTCLEWFKNNLTICDPHEPENITVVTDIESENRYRLNISWADPPQPPNYYTINIIDYSSESRQTFNISNGTTNSVQLSNILMFGLYYKLEITAHSIGGESSTIYHGKVDNSITFEAPVDHFYYLKAAAFISGPLLFILILVIIILKYVKIKSFLDCGDNCNYLEEYEIKTFTDNQLYENYSNNPLQVDQLRAIQLDFNFADDVMELHPGQIQFLEVIGEGAFGCVWRGILGSETVAIKMLKNGPSHTDIRNFYREIEVMKSVPKHPNILGIVGHCTNNILELMLVAEYCSEGNLLNFLRNIWKEQAGKTELDISIVSPGVTSKPNFHKCYSDCHFSNDEKCLVQHDTYQSNCSENIYINQGYELSSLSLSQLYIVENHGYGFDSCKKQNGIPITDLDLLLFACQIANGMDFLSVNKVVHRDLACRNVLVCADQLTVKISDFGLSRDIYHDNLYKKSSTGKLPIKWMAIESMTHQVYSSQSDVWSFGILLYEIVTKGAVPYPTVETSDILNFLKDGGRMERPNGCRTDMYNLMQSCWNDVPNERPTFKGIREKLDDIRREMTLTFP